MTTNHLSPMPHPPHHQFVEAFFSKDAAGAARILETYSVPDIISSLQWSSAKTIATVLGHVHPATAAEVVKTLPDSLGAKTVRHLPAPLAAAMLRRLSVDERDSFLQTLDPWVLDNLKPHLEYPPDSAGSLMRPPPNVVRQELSVEDALAQLGKPSSTETSSEVFVVTDESRFVGTLSWSNLLSAGKHMSLASLDVGSPPRIAPGDGKQTILQKIAGMAQDPLPIVDSKGVLLGCLTRQTIAELQRLTFLAPFHALTGTSSPQADDASRWETLRRHAPWIGVHLFIALAVMAGLAVAEPTFLTESRIGWFFPLFLILPPAFAVQSFGRVLSRQTLERASGRSNHRILGSTCQTTIALGGLAGLAIGTLAWFMGQGMERAGLIGALIWAALALAGIGGVFLGLGSGGHASARTRIVAVGVIVWSYAIGLAAFVGLVHWDS